jgi:DNA-binding beta-propeller fold protein YncE
MQSFSRPLTLALCFFSSHPLIAAAVTDGNVTTLAGLSSGFADGVGSNARFNFPIGVSFSLDGSYALVADGSNQLIRQIVLSTATVSSLAGLGSSSGSTNGVGSNARFNGPFGVSVSSDGSYALVVDWGNNLIRQIIISTATVSTLAGLASSSGSTNGVGSNAWFYRPRGVSVSSDGSYALVADQYNSLIRQIIISTATVSTLAGLALSSGSTNGVGSNALFNKPTGVSFSPDGSYALVGDYNNHLIRRIVLSTATVSSLAGLALSSGSTNGVGSNARFNYPAGVSFSSDGSYILVPEYYNHLIRRIVLSTATVSTLAGLALSSGSTNGVSSNARFNGPTGVSFSSDGSYVLVTDSDNHRIRQISVLPITTSPTTAPTSSPTAPTSSPTTAPTSSPTAPTSSPTTAPTSSPTTAPTSSSKYSFGVVFRDPESQGLRVGSAVLLDYFTSFGDEGLNSFYLEILHLIFSGKVTPMSVVVNSSQVSAPSDPLLASDSILIKWRPVLTSPLPLSERHSFLLTHC